MAIIDFDCNTKTKLHSGHTTMSGIPENPGYTPKSCICFYYVENNINVLFHGPNGGHLGFLRHLAC